MIQLSLSDSILKQENILNSHWLYKKKNLNESPLGMFGFVYMITNNDTGKMYIGRKYFHSTRRTKVAGKKRRKIVRKDSNWREYTGSSKKLNADILKMGKNKFKFEILVMGETKGQVNYLEENIHHKFHVVSRSKFYNDCVGPRRFGNVRLSESILSEIDSIKVV